MEKQIAQYATETLFIEDLQEHIQRLLKDEATDEDVLLILWCQSNKKRVYRPILRKWMNTGGFKRMYDLGNGTVRLVIQPSNNMRVFRMAIKEACIQHYLSKLYTFVTPIHCINAVRQGTLTIPVFELSLEMKQLSYTLVHFIHSSPPMHELKCMFLQICKILQEMRNKGITHNDLKPDNIMYVVVHDENNIPCSNKFYLIDFGLCSIYKNTGDDLFFFCWFLYHRMCNKLQHMIPLLRRQLYIPKTDIPVEYHKSIKCKDNGTHFDFSQSGTKHFNTPWQKQYFIDKDVLYAISQKKSPTHDVDIFASDISRLLQ